MSGEQYNYVELGRFQELAFAEMLCDVLAQSKIPTTKVGANHRSLLGIVGGYVQISIQVPKQHLNEAKSIMLSLQTPSEEFEALMADESPSAFGTLPDSEAKKPQGIADRFIGFTTVIIIGLLILVVLGLIRDRFF